MSIQTVRRLFCSGGDKGGTGKSVILALVADWLRLKGLKRVYIDADPGNQDTEQAFENFLNGQPVTRVNIQDPEDLDRIFNIAAKSTCDVLADLPSNSSTNTLNWFHNVASKDMFDSAGIQLITLVPITPQSGVTGALKFLETVGPNGTFIICLNRIGYQQVPKPKERLFAEWFAVEAPQEYDIRTLEIGHLDDFSMKKLVAAKCLPHQVTGLDGLDAKRIKETWAQKVYDQLDALSL